MAFGCSQGWIVEEIIWRHLLSEEKCKEVAMVRYAEAMYMDGERFIDYCSESDWNDKMERLTSSINGICV